MEEGKKAVELEFGVKGNPQSWHYQADWHGTREALRVYFV